MNAAQWDFIIGRTCAVLLIIYFTLLATGLI